MEHTGRIIDKGEQTFIPFNDLELNPHNTYEAVDIEDLAGSISAVGQISPLSVIGPSEKGKYRIIAGERRYLAIKKLNEEDQNPILMIPCYIMGPYTMAERTQQLAIELSNLETRDFSKDEHRFRVIRLLKEMADENQLEHRHIVRKAKEYMSVSDRYCRMYLNIFEKGDGALIDLVNSKKVTVTSAAAIANMDRGKQKEIVRDIQEGVKPQKAIQKHKESVNTQKAKESDELFVSETDYNESVAWEDTGVCSNGGCDEEIEIPDWETMYAETVKKYGGSDKSSIDTTGLYRKLVGPDRQYNVANINKKECICILQQLIQRLPDISIDDAELIKAAMNLVESVEAAGGLSAITVVDNELAS